MSVQDVLNDFGSKVAGLKAADTVVGTKEVELDGAQSALSNANVVQHDAKVAAKVSFDIVLAEVAKLGLDTVEVSSGEGVSESDDKPSGPNRPLKLPV